MSQLKLVPTYTAWRTEARACKQLAQSCYVVVHRPGGEPVTFRSRIRRPTTEPPRRRNKEIGQELGQMIALVERICKTKTTVGHVEKMNTDKRPI